MSERRDINPEHCPAHSGVVEAVSDLKAGQKEIFAKLDSHKTVMVTLLAGIVVGLVLQVTILAKPAPIATAITNDPAVNLNLKALTQILANQERIIEGQGKKTP